MDYLAFQLLAPIAAMGDIAVGERRTSWTGPARSAVYGLVAAALGIDREDAAGHQALEEGYGYAVATLSAGRPLRDFHTVQTVPAKGIKEIGRTTRRKEIAWLDDNPDTNPLVSLRDYRADAWFVVVVWPRANPRWTLVELVKALERPDFVPYFGRRACPFAAPLSPGVIAAADVADALMRYLSAPLADGSSRLGSIRSWGWSVDDNWSIAADSDALLPAPRDSARIETRRDAVVTRKPPRRFAPRRETVFTVTPPEVTP
jgi:CRISPR system Cascade subunit CasD